MINPISNAIREIQMTIPSQILTEVFGREDYRNWRRAAPVSIDEMIKSKVIRPRVLKDCNLVGGRQVIIDLVGIEGHQEDHYTVIYNIPLSVTGNREIISVLSVGYVSMNAIVGSPGYAYATATPTSMSDLETAGQRVMDSMAAIPHISTASVEMIGYNTIIIRDPMRSNQSYQIRCVISNEENLNNISPRSYPVLAKACLLAVKSYIYNQLNIRIDQGMLEQGQALGKFRDVVDDYKESEEQYQEYLKMVLRKVFFMNDVSSYDRYIGIQINPSV